MPGAGAAASACASYWGRSSVMVNHGALEPTKMCSRRADGRVVDEGAHGDVDEGAVADDASRAASRTAWQRASWPFSSPKIMSWSAPLVMRSLSRSMPANGLNAEPVAAGSSRSGSSRRRRTRPPPRSATAPHWHVPTSVRTLALSGLVTGSSISDNVGYGTRAWNEAIEESGVRTKVVRQVAPRCPRDRRTEKMPFRTRRSFTRDTAASARRPRFSIRNLS